MVSALIRLWQRGRDGVGRALRAIRGFRRISFTRFGGLFSAGALGVGFAAINTGNNLL